MTGCKISSLGPHLEPAASVLRHTRVQTRVSWLQVVEPVYTMTFHGNVHPSVMGFRLWNLNTMIMLHFRSLSCISSFLKSHFLF
jgi:hypothetical protein